MKKTYLGAVAIVVGITMAGCSSNAKASSPKSTSSSSTSGSGASTPGTTATGTPIKVGLICTCSGPLAASSPASEHVYEAWARSVNSSGGINGHPVTIVAKDDAANPGTSVAAMTSLLADHVVAIVDLSLLDETWAATVQRAEVPVIGGSPTETPFYTNPDFYPVGETIDALPYAFAATAKAAGATSMANFYCAEAAVCQETITSITSIGKKLGVPDVYNASVAFTAPNYTAQCVAAQQAHAGAILNGDVDSVFKRVAANCNQQGYHPIYVSAGESYDVSMNTATGITDNSWYEGNDLPFFAANAQVTAMNAAVNKYFPGLVNKPDEWTGGSSVEMWASGLLLEQAVKAGGLGASGTPTAQEIIQGLASINNDTLDGLAPPLTFTSGQPHPIHCWFTFRVQHGTPSMVNGGRTTCENGASS